MTCERLTPFAVVGLLIVAAPVERTEACHVPVQSEYLSAAQESLAAHGHGSQARIPYKLEQSTACENGMADIFPCENVDLLAHLPLEDIGGGSGNDIWGWRDGGEEYALIGRSTGTAFVNMTDPENPVYLGDLPTVVRSSAWRDIKVYKNHAYVVSDSAGQHGMQVFDLTRLRSVNNPPVQFDADARYEEFGSAHNLVINEDTGFAYAVGADVCAGGLHMIDIREPKAPVLAGCFDDDGYTHDAQCVVYQGGDARYRGSEICFASNEDSVTVVDVSDKSNPVMLSRNGYEGSAYTHQGWLTEDHGYFVVDDELDESRRGHNARTYVWDMSDLESPQLTGFHESPRMSIDHNQYVMDGFTYQANYQQGLTILELVDPATASLDEAAFFDTYPESNRAQFDGAWSVYPYLKSGAVIISDINRGLFIVRPRLSRGLFIDGFESGNLDNWSRSKGNVGITSPGLKKSGFAFEVTVDGTDAVSQIVSLQPAREKSLETSLLLQVNQVDLGGGEVEVLRFVSPRKKTIVSLTLEQRGNKYFVNLSAESGGEMEQIGSTPVPRKKAVLLRVDWQQATDANSNNGSIRLIKKKRVRASRSTLDTIATIDAVRLGLPSGSAGAVGGSVVFDDCQVSQ